jgi:hypothetical protein
LVWKAVGGSRRAVIKGVLVAAVHRRWDYRYMGVHKVEEGGLVVGGGVVFRWVVIPLFVEDDYVSVKLEVGIGGVGGVLVRTVIRGSRRQVWRAGGEVVFVVIVEMGGGECWGVVSLTLVVYIVMAVHCGGDCCVL